MNTGNTTTTHDSPAPTAASSDDFSAYTYDMAFVLGFVMLVVLIILASYMCIRANYQPPLPSRPPPIQNPTPRLVSGINEATLLSYPKIIYSNTKADQGGTTCPICLGDYRGSDILRLLPDCGHFFHVKCVDPWLRSSPTCPVCRKFQSAEGVHNSVVLGD